MTSDRRCLRQRSASGLVSFGPFAPVVGAALRVTTDSGERDEVQAAVELPVPAPVEPVSHCAPGRGRNRCAAVRSRECVPSGVAAHIDDLGEDAGRDQHTDAVDAAQPGVGLVNGVADLFGQFCDLSVQTGQPVQPPPGQLGPDAGVTVQRPVRGGQLTWPGQVGNRVVVAAPQSGAVNSVGTSTTSTLSRMARWIAAARP
jgi:hypothetical protein